MAIFSGGAAARPFRMNEQGELRWVCGGIGPDERDSLAKMEPVCLVQAPAGRYHVEAEFKDVKRAVDTRVAKDARQPGTE